MRYSLWKLFLCLTICAVVAAIYAAYINDPARELRAFGASYRSDGQMDIVGIGPSFDRTRIKNAVIAIEELQNPCSLSITGNSFTDADLVALHDAKNIVQIYFGESNISNTGLVSLAKIKSLKEITIERCKMIDNNGIVCLEEIRPDLKIKGWWILSRNNGGPPTLTGR